MTEVTRNLTLGLMTKAANWFSLKCPGIPAVLYGSIVAYYYGLRKTPPQDIDILTENPIPPFEFGLIDQSNYHNIFPLLKRNATVVEGEVLLPTKENYIASRLLSDTKERNLWLWEIVKTYSVDELFSILKAVHTGGTFAAHAAVSAKLRELITLRRQEKQQ